MVSAPTIYPSFPKFTPFPSNLGLEVTKNGRHAFQSSQLEWEFSAETKGHVQRNPDQSCPEWVALAMVPVVNLLEPPYASDLYPAFGQVKKVERNRDRLYFELAESPLQGLIAIPIYDTKQPLPSWMLREGQMFEAMATLAETDATRFSIGCFGTTAHINDADVATELRSLAQIVDTVRF